MNPGTYNYTMAFWHILAAKLAFVVIFEVMIFFYSGNQMAALPFFFRPIKIFFLSFSSFIQMLLLSINSLFSFENFLQQTVSYLNYLFCSMCRIWWYFARGW